MSQSWDHYGTLQPLYSEPLCVHQLVKERARLCAELLTLTVQECGGEMPRDAAVVLQRALAVVQQLRGTLTRQPSCGCRPRQGTEEASDATAPDSDD